MIALATAQQESRLRNLDYGDRDSLGLFQQRPSQGWGTEAQVQDPAYAAGKFYDWLVTVPGWETGTSRRRPGRAAQRVPTRLPPVAGLCRGTDRGCSVRRPEFDDLRPDGDVTARNTGAGVAMMHDNSVGPS